MAPLALVVLVVGLLVAGGPGSVGVAGADPEPAAFVPLSPARLLDTRGGTTTVDGQAAGGGAVAGGDAGVRTLPVLGRGGVPADGVSAVVLNVTATEAVADTYVTVFPTGTTRPTASNLNVRIGQTVPNLVVVKVGTGGSVSLFNLAGSVNLVADVAGYFDAGSTAFTPTAPQRFLDTRPGFTTIDGQAQGVGAVGPGGVIDLTIAGRSDLPSSGVGSVVLNVTATAPTDDTYVTVYPTGATPPTASNLNVRAGQTVPNLVIAKVGTDGKVSLRNFAGTSHLVADVVGWFADGTPAYTGLTPARLADTRPGGPTVDGQQSGEGRLIWRRAGLPEQEEYTVQVTGRGGVPSAGVGAVVLNVTATDADDDTYLTVHPTNRALPVASNLNVEAGRTIANLVVARPGPDGRVAIYLHDTTAHLVVDVVGWFPAVPVDGPVTVWGCPEFDMNDCVFGSVVPDRPPVALDGLAGGLPITDVATGRNHTVALRGDGSVIAWGTSLGGALGNPAFTSTSTPVPVVGLGVGSGVIDVAATSYGSLALKADGTVLVWGLDPLSAKSPSPTYRPAPTPMAQFGAGSGVTELHAGESTAAAVKGAGDELHLWGALAPIANLPQLVSYGVDEVALGWDHLVILFNDGSVGTVGRNEGGQLGVGDTAARGGLASPAGLGAGTVRNVVASVGYSFAVKADGSVVGWGYIPPGLAAGAVTTPTAVPGLGAGSGVEELATGYGQVLARKADGSVLAWGADNRGQTGTTLDPTGTIVAVPTPVLGLGPGSGVRLVAAAGAHSLAIS